MTTPTTTPRALTIRQPWADAITHGTKRTENRTWPLPTRHHGARILIHAAKTIDPHVRAPQPGSPLEGTSTAVRGAVTAIATLTGCHWSDVRTGACCCAPWGMPGLYHWTLDDVTALPEPVPCKGALGFWTPPTDVLDAVTAAAAGGAQ